MGVLRDPGKLDKLFKGEVFMRRAILILSCVLLTASYSNAEHIAWVSFHPADDSPSTAASAAGFTEAPDIGYTSLLASEGHSVERYVTTGTPDVDFLNTFDLVIIGRSVSSGDYSDAPETAAWNGITAPTMVLGGYLLRSSRLGYTTGTTIPDTAGTVGLTVVDPAHPIFAGISLDAGNTMVNPYASIQSFQGTDQRGISVNADPLVGGGNLLATIGTAGDPAVGGMVIGEYAAGTVLGTGDTLGGDRLVFLTGSREADNLTSQGAGIYDLEADGTTMFLNAVDYMTVPEPSTFALLGIGGLAPFLFRRRR